MIAQITTLMIGFSVFSAAILLFAYTFFLKHMHKSMVAVLSCIGLLGGLAALQIQHLMYLRNGIDLFDTAAYVTALLITPPSFYFFSKEVLLPENKKSLFSILHFVPFALSFFLAGNIVAPFAFVVGTGYAFWFSRFVFGMRAQRQRFRIEMFFFSLFALLALLVLILGLAIPYVDPAIFYLSYANFIGVALLLVVGALIVFPELLNDISDAAQLTYASSTLAGVDIDASLHRLDGLMEVEKIYQNENLSLSMLADALDLSSHQLSELINTSFGIGFSRYIREQRIKEAQRLLREDTMSSVLAISLMTGFKSQSNFYAAFREITGETPGNYRKKL